MKTCTKCEIEKELEDFHKCAANNDGRTPWCKLCNSEYQKNHRKVNKEKISRSRKRAYILDREDVLASQKVYRETHKDQLRKSKSKYYQENKDSINAKSKDKYKETRESVIEANRLYVVKNKLVVAERRKEYAKKNQVKISTYQKIYRRKTTNNFNLWEQKLSAGESVISDSEGNILVGCKKCEEMFYPYRHTIKRQG